MAKFTFILLLFLVTYVTMYLSFLSSSNSFVFMTSFTSDNENYKNNGLSCYSFPGHIYQMTTRAEHSLIPLPLTEQVKHGIIHYARLNMIYHRHVILIRT